jgi:hypothetical protein
MQVSVKLTLPDETYTAYEALKQPIEKVFADRLVNCVDFTSKKPLYITDYQRQRLDRLFGRNFASTDELLRAIEKALSVRIEGIPINLNPTLLTRLRSRCFGKTFEKFLEELTVQGLEEYAGMR